MKQADRFYINGEWVEPAESNRVAVINPATEKPVAEISMAGFQDLNNAVAAAKAAFPAFSRTRHEERLSLLDRLVEKYQARSGDLAEAMTMEMGAPDTLSRKAQVAAGLGHILTAGRILQNFEFEEDFGTTHVFKEPVGVCGFITPWNWPLNQIMCKVAPALAVGCTMVLKPSRDAPLNAYILAEIIDAAGFPGGVFNLVNGAGPEVGKWLAGHPDVDMVSFTGSTAAGAHVSRYAADTIKRVTLELGGKSAFIILDDADMNDAVKSCVKECCTNTGQSCSAPTRMLVPVDHQEEIVEIAKTVAGGIIVGPPDDPKTFMGPQAHKEQWDKVQGLIRTALDEGCRLVCGGPGRPGGLEVGYYTRPTIFADVKNSHTIAQKEVFGPVLSIIPYRDEEEAVAIANDTIYGLSGYVFSGDLERARRIALQMRTGMVHLNGASTDINAPFGGYKQSGNGREWGIYGFNEFLEVKAVMGYQPE